MAKEDRLISYKGSFLYSVQLLKTDNRKPSSQNNELLYDIDNECESQVFYKERSCGI